jgi:hypothetical protein
MSAAVGETSAGSAAAAAPAAAKGDERRQTSTPQDAPSVDTLNAHHPLADSRTRIDATTNSPHGATSGTAAGALTSRTRAPATSDDVVPPRPSSACDDMDAVQALIMLHQRSSPMRDDAGAAGSSHGGMSGRLPDRAGDTFSDRGTAAALPDSWGSAGCKKRTRSSITGGGSPKKRPSTGSHSKSQASPSQNAVTAAKRVTPRGGETAAGALAAAHEAAAVERSLRDLMMAANAAGNATRPCGLAGTPPSSEALRDIGAVPTQWPAAAAAPDTTLDSAVRERIIALLQARALGSTATAQGGPMSARRGSESVGVSLQCTPRSGSYGEAPTLRRVSMSDPRRQSLTDTANHTHAGAFMPVIVDHAFFCPPQPFDPVADPNTLLVECPS